MCSGHIQKSLAEVSSLYTVLLHILLKNNEPLFKKIIYTGYYHKKWTLFKHLLQEIFHLCNLLFLLQIVYLR